LRRFYFLDEINISSLMWLDPSNHFKAWLEQKDGPFPEEGRRLLPDCLE
jgi:hypothetical protein